MPPQDAQVANDLEKTRTADGAPPVVDSHAETRDQQQVPPQAEVSTGRNDSTPTPEQHDLPPKYTFVRVLGRGGMGEVVHAYDAELQRHVAIKFMRAKAAASVFARRRFQDEAPILAQLQHPNVVDVYERGEFKGEPYFVMAYLNGHSLANRLGEFRTSAGRAVGVIVGVADGVQHAHEHGVFHRDLKASNVMFDAGRPVVVDFGCARWEDAELSTMGFALLGTPSHMAPEVYERGSKEHDARADLWSLGVMLYHLLAGELPFNFDPLTAEGRARVQTEDPLPIRSHRGCAPGVDDRLEAIVAKALAKNPDDRYQTAATFAAELQEWQGTVAEATPVSVPRPVVKRHRAVTLALVGILATAGVIAAAVWWPKPTPAVKTLAERLQKQDDSVEFVGLTGLPEGRPAALAGVIGSVSLSPEKLCELESARVFLVELGDEALPFPYRISAEVRTTTTGIDTKVGVYASRAAHPQPDGTVVHAAFVNSFGLMSNEQKVPRFAGKDGWGAFPARIALVNNTFAPTNGAWQPVAQDPPPTDETPGPFHLVEIEVRPDRWLAFRDGQPAKARPLPLDSRKTAEGATAAAFDRLGETLTTPAFGGGFGLFVFQGGGQFRNVRIVRLAD